MKSLNVMIIIPSFFKTTPELDEEIRRCIEQAAPGVKVSDASTLAFNELRGDKSRSEEFDALLAETEVIYGLILPPGIVERAPKLKWLQTTSAGVDRLTQTDVWHSDVIITNASGIHATPIGEFVLGTMLMFAKGAIPSFAMKAAREWRRYRSAVLRSQTVGIVGLGNIGREVARLSKAFGMNVIATRRSAKKEGRARNVDRLLPAARLKELLAESDYVVIAAPLTGETAGLIGEPELAAMKPTAYIINIARGGLIDEDALVKALEEKKIAGAGLDVTAREPLPSSSRLWELENVILSPHVSGDMDDYMERATELFCKNIRRYVSGKRLFNIVNKKLGY